MSEVVINGTMTALTTGATVRDVVRSMTEQDSGCAVAVNGEVIPRSGWEEHVLRDGDRVEVLTAVQGG
jgi:sulfur carrier protein